MSKEQNLTFAQAFGGSRDMCCIAAVGDMAAMGRFDEEFHMYGCACLEQNQITYRITPSAEQIYHFVMESTFAGRFPTRIHTYSESLPVPAGMKTRIERRVKLTLAKEIQKRYPVEYYHLVQRLGAVPSDNHGLPIVETLRTQIDGHFDELECQLFQGTMQIVYEAKHLNRESMEFLQRWLEKTRKQMEDTPFIQRNMSRIFHGFCYKKGNKPIKTVVNAQAVTVWEQHEKLQREGCLTGPILHEEQWFDDAADISQGRVNFRETVQKLQNADYFEGLQAVKALPSVVDAAAFHLALKELKEIGKTDAVEDLCGYGYRWNCL